MLAHVAGPGVTLDVPFRGQRDYVHSTDLYASLEKLAERNRVSKSSQAYVKRLTLRKKAHRQVSAYFLPHSDAFGTFSLSMAGQKVEGWLVETCVPITRQVAFDESGIALKAVVEPGRAFLREAVKGFSSFEQAIVLLKVLCAQHDIGPWLFTNIALDRPLVEDALLGVSRMQTVLDRLIDARLFQNGQESGRLQMVLARTR